MNNYHNQNFQQNSFANGRNNHTGPVASDESDKSVSKEVFEIWQQRARRLASSPQMETAGELLDLLVFRSGAHQYGLEVNYVREIHPLPQITPVPRTPDFVVGVFSARGRLISIIDLQAFMGIPAKKPTAESKIIVVAAENSYSHGRQLEIGLLADEVSDVTAIFREDLLTPLTAGYGRQAEFATGITTDMLMILNLNTLLNDKELIIQEEIL